ncbi:MAG TPA: hypothetical protein VGY98_19990 [Verrucomicrobiae bacterium]|nr:hypothetical protein [Verrucomicrobiae bacterium]
MPVCIYSKKPFVKSSKEHILQNSLGARWSSGQIVCDRLQTEFGRTIDSALEKSISPIRNLLGTTGGRGGAGPTLRSVPVTSGETIDLLPGAQPRLAKPIVEITSADDNTSKAKIQAGNLDQLNWALAMLREQFPNLKIDLEEIKGVVQPTTRQLSGHAALKMTLGGKDPFRAMLKSCFNLLGVNNANAALLTSCDKIRNFIMDGTGKIEDFVRWIPEPGKLVVPKIGQADHFIGIMSIRNGIEGIVQLFGEMRFAVRLSEKYEGPQFRYGYLVNPFRDSEPPESREPKFGISCIPIFSDQSTKNTAAIQRTFTVAVERLGQLYYQRAYNARMQKALKDAVAEILVPATGKKFTPELLNSFVQKYRENLESVFTKSNG